MMIPAFERRDPYTRVRPANVFARSGISSTAVILSRGLRMLGLPDGAAACLFDLDGVLTRTAAVHAAAWKEMFDDYLRERARRTGEPFTEFDLVKDYGRYVDGKKREDGTRSFLESRGIVLPEGSPDDPPESETVRGLGNRKNELVLKFIEEKGVETFDGSIDYVRAARKKGLKTAVVSSSANTVQVLRTVGITDLFDARVDGVVAAERGLPGKPAPDTFVEAARELGVEPAQAAVFEDALAGVQAGRAGGFAYVVGVNRMDEAHAKALAEHGADIVVSDLSELLEVE
ncbi:MAG TPA: beta-phosphoglucomutase family hydrolase [Vulgatibacteraceae bacterium]|nr:beta-phosphoglucomutase family hydrolase [Vulgatibacteraceae bacterium]